jgi:hypothetical protein
MQVGASSQALVFYQFADDTGGSGFFGSERFELSGRVVGQFDRQFAAVMSP